jgi:hypothetical protein
MRRLEIFSINYAIALQSRSSRNSSKMIVAELCLTVFGNVCMKKNTNRAPKEKTRRNLGNKKKTKNKFWGKRWIPKKKI